MSASRTRRQPRAPGSPDYGALEAVKQAMESDAPIVLVKRMPNGRYSVLPLWPEEERPSVAC